MSLHLRYSQTFQEDLIIADLRDWYIFNLELSGLENTWCETRQREWYQSIDIYLVIVHRLHGRRLGRHLYDRSPAMDVGKSRMPIMARKTYSVRDSQRG